MVAPSEPSASSWVIPRPLEASAFLATQSVAIVVATLVVIARIYVRSVVLKNVGLDDLFVVISLIIAFVICAMTILAVFYGQHYSSQLSQQGQTIAAFKTLAKTLKFCTIATSLGIFSALLTRLSFCLSLLRIFRSVREWKLGLYAVMVITSLAIIPPFVTFVAQCQPAQAQWDPLVPGHCLSKMIVIRANYFYGAVSTLCDWTLATLPIVFMWNVQMEARVKVGVCVLMGMGYFTGICSILRTIGFSDDTASASEENHVGSIIWAALEINVGIVAASIPTLKPLFRSSVPSLRRYFRYRKATDSPQCGDDEARLQELSLGTMPSALPSSISYYQGRSNVGVEEP